MIKKIIKIVYEKKKKKTLEKEKKNLFENQIIIICTNIE